MAAKEAASSALKVVVFLGSVRENNMGSRAAKFLTATLKKRGHHVDLLGNFTGFVVHVIVNKVEGGCGQTARILCIARLNKAGARGRLDIVRLGGPCLQKLREYIVYEINVP